MKTPIERPKRREASDDQQELPPSKCQKMVFLDCDKPVRRVIFECYHCRQGIIAQCHSDGNLQRLEPACPHCGKSAIRLEATEVFGITAISSPWQ